MYSSILLLLLMVYYLYYYKVLHQRSKHARQAFQTIEPFLKKYLGCYPHLALSDKTTVDPEIHQQLAELAVKPYETLAYEEKIQLYRLYFSYCQNHLETSGQQALREVPELLFQLRQTLADSWLSFEEALHTYNQQVKKYNDAIAHFPSNIIANLLSYEKYPCLTIDESVKIWLMDVNKPGNSRLNS